MKLKRSILAASMMAAAMGASTVSANDLGGFNTVLVQGFQPQHLLDGRQSSDDLRQGGDQYWADFWDSRSSARIDWDSNLRVEGGIAQQAYQQIREIAINGTCANGCVFVTHSTGDLVTRYLLDNMDRWLRNDGLQPFDVVATVDLAGAGGGTDLADLGMSVAENDSWLLEPAKSAVQAFLGFDTIPDNMGVVNDLQPSVARSTAVSPNNVPRLRVVGGGAPFLGATQPFITGTDDGVVPVASSCGAVEHASFDSCVSDQAMDGKKTSVSAPDSLWYNHFPLLMSEGSKHNAMLGKETGHVATPVLNNASVGGLAISQDSHEYNDSPWWEWWTSGDNYIEVPGSENTHLSETTFNAF